MALPVLVAFLLLTARRSEGATITECPAHLRRPLGDMKVAPLVTGMWQVSGAHGYQAQQAAALADMAAYAAAGLNCFDLADHVRVMTCRRATINSVLTMRAAGPLAVPSCCGSPAVWSSRGFRGSVHHIRRRRAVPKPAIFSHEVGAAAWADGGAQG
jgi:hypothetical protein